MSASVTQAQVPKYYQLGSPFLPVGIFQAFPEPIENNILASLCSYGVPFVGSIEKLAKHVGQNCGRAFERAVSRLRKIKVLRRVRSSEDGRSYEWELNLESISELTKLTFIPRHVPIALFSGAGIEPQINPHFAGGTKIALNKEIKEEKRKEKINNTERECARDELRMDSFKGSYSKFVPPPARDGFVDWFNDYVRRVSVARQDRLFTYVYSWVKPYLYLGKEAFEERFKGLIRKDMKNPSAYLKVCLDNLVRLNIENSVGSEDDFVDSDTEDEAVDYSDVNADEVANIEDGLVDDSADLGKKVEETIDYEVVDTVDDGQAEAEIDSSVENKVKTDIDHQDIDTSSDEIELDPLTIEVIREIELLRDTPLSEKSKEGLDPLVTSFDYEVVEKYLRLVGFPHVENPLAYFIALLTNHDEREEAKASRKVKKRSEGSKHKQEVKEEEVEIEVEVENAELSEDERLGLGIEFSINFANERIEALRRKYPEMPDDYIDSAVSFVLENIDQLEYVNNLIELEDMLIYLHGSMLDIARKSPFFVEIFEETKKYVLETFGVVDESSILFTTANKIGLPLLDSWIKRRVWR